MSRKPYVRKPYITGPAFFALLMLSTTASAIPSRDPHPHAAENVTWSQAAIPPADPDTTNHQHNSGLDIRGVNGSYDGYAVWNSERTFDGHRDMWSRPEGAGTAPLGLDGGRTFGHGFIAGDFISAIEYAFVGEGWVDANKAIVNAAFAHWESEAKTRANGSVVGQGGALVRRPGTIVGINFDEDTLFTSTNFEIRWAPLDVSPANPLGNPFLAAEWFADDSPVDAAAFDLELVFNTGASFNNARGDTGWLSDPEKPMPAVPAGPDSPEIPAIPGEWDFYSVVLHEIGHILGLKHFSARTDGCLVLDPAAADVNCRKLDNLMSASDTSFSLGHSQRYIDTADLQGAVDLYSIHFAVPEPGALPLLVTALAGLILVRSRNRSASTS